MTRITYLCLVCGSVALGVTADAARPRYGGTLRVETQAALLTLDPSVPVADAADAAVRDAILPLVFETLVAVDPVRGIRPLLATSWEIDASFARWRLPVRPNVRLHDGSMLEPAHVAAALQERNRDWLITIDGNAVVIQPGGPRPDLLVELAEARNAIAVGAADGTRHGTGPFRIQRLDAARMVLAAHDGHWNSRPYLDVIQVELRRPFAAQLTSLETGRADMVAVRPADARRLVQRPLRVSASRPTELFALVFESHRSTAAELPLRRALSGAIDRASLARVLLQGYGDAATSLLPSWVSGYPGFMLPLVPPRSSVAVLPAEQRSLVLRVTAGDVTARAMADRIAVDARDAGFVVTVQVPAGLAPRADLRLVRVPLTATAPDRSLAALMAALGPRIVSSATREVPPPSGASLDVVNRVERSLLEPSIVVPLAHVPVLYALGDRVDWLEGDVVLPSGQWNLANAWIEPDRAAQP